MSGIATSTRATSPGSTPRIAASIHSPSAWMIHARSSVERSRPARPGMKRRTGITIQLVVSSTANTKNVTTVSTRKIAICANISALPQLVAELRSATACGFEGLHDLFRKPFLLEHLERRLRGAALRSDLLAQLGWAV